VAAFALGAMEIKVTGHQLFLSGPVIGDEFDKVQKILADDPAIDTAILCNSLGGDAPTGYRIGELLRAKGLRTVVSGYCYSSWALGSYLDFAAQLRSCRLDETLGAQPAPQNRLIRICLISALTTLRDNPKKAKRS
jgi:hypothetical protein